MRYKFEIRDELDVDPWHEEYDVPTHIEPKDYIEGVLSRFNSNLYPNESPRTMLSFELVGSPKDHKWEKQNAFTVVRGSSNFDVCKCTRCNITCKRYGISGVFTVDSKFKAKVYRQCDTSIAHQKKKEERRRRKEEGIA